jgi:serine/threonine protein kinase
MEVAERQTILTPGYRLGAYRIESFLGQGGFGVTYLAHDTMLDLPVAIKEYMPDQLASRAHDSTVHPRSPDASDDFQWGLTSFIREAQTLARFKHPNIVRIMSVFELNGTAYMVMEYESGQDLKALLSGSSTTSQRQLEQIIGPIIDGLGEVHRHGYIHRDIKPANIRIRHDGSPVLLDFGSARQATESKSSALTALVSAGFAPLEQYTGSDGNQQGPWTDIYALGAVLYFAVTGNAPIDSALRGSALLNDKPDPLTRLTQLAPRGFTPAFCRAVDWALSFKVKQRPQSLAQWRSRLIADENTWRAATSGKSGQSAAAGSNKTRSDDFLDEIDLQLNKADQSSAGEDFVVPRALGPDDPTVIQVRPSAKPANTAKFDRDKDFTETDAADDTWDISHIAERAARQQQSKSPLPDFSIAPRQIEWIKKSAALVTGAALTIVMLVLLFPSLLTLGKDAAVNSDLSADDTAASTQLNVPGQGTDSVPQQISSESDGPSSSGPDIAASGSDAGTSTEVTTADQVAPLSTEETIDRSLQSGQQPNVVDNNPETGVEADTTSISADAQKLEDDQTVARAVQAAEARRQLELERRRQAERDLTEDLQVLRSQRTTGAGDGVSASDPARSVSSDSERFENLIRQQNPGLGDSSSVSNNQQSPMLLPQGSNQAIYPQASPSASSNSDNLVAGLVPRQPEQEQPQFFRPAITDRDMAVVLRQFDALSLAIEKRDTEALRELTHESARKNAYFDYLFRTFEEIEVGVTNIQGNRQDQKITGTMHIRRMIRANGDIAFPPAEFRNIELHSVRTGNWSKIHW